LVPRRWLLSLPRYRSHQLGYAYRFLEKFDEAERAFKKYTELIPGDPNPYGSNFNYGYVRAKARKLAGT
jgi:Flp pilus assembly protein TadD